jgi:hypothetical protein
MKERKSKKQMGKKKYYLTLDTETATLPYANEVCKTAAQKQKIAIAKPLVYDIGWTVSDRQGNSVFERNYLVQETFFVPNVFNTAYYKNKRPIYMEMYKNEEIEAKNWNDIITILIADLEMVDITTAFNACFDFKKAIPYTERYIENLYSENYTRWEEGQKASCNRLLMGIKPEENPDYLKPWFELRGQKYPLADLWQIACNRLINIDKYRDYCLKNKLLTASAIYFKTSAETCFQYLMNNYNFIEDHTALSDARIEKDILTKALKKGAVRPELGAFPFRLLGETHKYVQEKRPKYAETVAELIGQYLDGVTKESTFSKRLETIYAQLTEM